MKLLRKKETNQNKDGKAIQKSELYLELIVIFTVIVVLNILGNIYYSRLDLTSEKKFTLSNTSKELCKKIKDQIVFKLYLDGEMSSRFKQLRDEIRDLAYEFREASNKKIEIEIVNPLKDVPLNQVNKTLSDFAKKGLIPIMDKDETQSNDTRTRRIIPGGELIYRDKEVSLNFFNFDIGLSQNNIDENFRRAKENLEYELANGIRQCIQTSTKKIAFIQGNGEMVDNRIGSFTLELSKIYSLEPLNLNVDDPEAARPWIEQIKNNKGAEDSVFLTNLQRRLNTFDAIVITKPEYDYTPTELYLIDQYVMKGGKVIWFLDPVRIDLDSFQRNAVIPAMSRNLENITASLFRYGVTVNADLLSDLYCNKIPQKNQNQINMYDFIYTPIFTNRNIEHIISKNTGSILGQFSSTLKLHSRPELNIVPILQSSPYTRTAVAPATIDLQSSFYQFRDSSYRARMVQGIQTIGALLEGKFNSIYSHQTKQSALPFLAQGTSKMLVFSDADLIRNQLSSRGEMVPTGFDRYTGITFANKKYLLNCIDYLIDDFGLIEIRNKNQELRLLDAVKSKSERGYWQWFNILIPLIAVLILGIFNFLVRKKKYQTSK